MKNWEQRTAEILVKALALGARLRGTGKVEDARVTGITDNIIHMDIKQVKTIHFIPVQVEISEKDLEE